MRKKTEHFDLTETVNNVNSKQICEPKLILERRTYYFNKLLNTVRFINIEITIQSASKKLNLTCY